jgi:dihydrolipoamide dehydrogenase
MDHLLGNTDRQCSDELKKILTKQGMEFRLSTKCLGAQMQGEWLIVQAEDMATGQKVGLECDAVLVATGRRPYTQGLGLETIGVALDKQGRIPVDQHFQTSAPGVYAIGDVIAGPMLAHKAEDEGVAAVELMAGQKGHVNYDAIPNIVYTWPELASVGYSEEELKMKGTQYALGTFPFLANGRARAMDEIDGFVKILSDAVTGRVLGVHIVGPRASDMIAEAVAVIEYGGSAEDIARTCHAHPTLAEVMREAALAVGKRAIHI